MKYRYFILLLVPIFAVASGVNGGEKDYDIVPRTINFLIFAAILYYLIADPIKKAYKGRINSISAKLESIQEKLKASKAVKNDAIRRVEEAKANAKGLIQVAKKESELLVSKIENDAQNEIKFLEKSYEDQKEFEERKIVKEVVSEVLDEVFADDTLKFDQKNLLNLVIKKVA